MKSIRYSLLAATALPFAFADAVELAYPASNNATFQVVGSIAERSLGVPLSGAEIPAFDPASKRGFLATPDGIEVIDLTDPANPAYIGNINLTAATGSNDISSVAAKNGLLAAGVISSPKTDPGHLVILDAATGNILETIQVGSVPDDVKFTPDGTRILVANEGELDGDPNADTVPGSVTIIDISEGTTNPPVTTAGFAAFNAQAAALKVAGVRIFDGALPEFDFEPEYIAIAPDGLTAMVTLQEANAIGVLDILAGEFTSVVPLGEKDFSTLSADLSDRDGPDKSQLLNPTTGNPVFGLYMPDQIAAFEANGQTYYITANEGDDRDDFLSTEETIRVKDDAYALDPTVFPNSEELKKDASLGRLTVSNSPGLRGDTDGDGDIDRILMLGARSFSILDASGNMVFDSGDMLEMIVATQFPDNFDDGRSDNKGPEPEGVTVASFGGHTYAFVGLERSNMVLVFDVTNPLSPTYVTALRHDGDVSPEGMHFISPADSPNGRALLMIANEVSNTLTIHQLESHTPEKFSLELFHLTDQEANAAAVEDAPRLSGILNALRAQDIGNDGLADNSLTLSSGDAIIPGLFYGASGPVYGSAGIADIQIQNELGIQAMAFGNHEFDFGTAVLASLIDGSAPGEILGSDFTGTNFPYLSGNLDFTSDASMAPLVTDDHQAPQPNKIAATTVIDVNGEKIGIVAATTPTLGTISSPGDVGISPSPFAGAPSAAELDALAAIIQADVDALLLAEPTINKVILLAHMQSISIEQALTTRLRHVDIIVAGGSNTRLFDSDDRIRDGDTNQGTYPIFLDDADSNPIALVNTDGSYKYLGRLVIDFSPSGIIIPSSYDPSISGAYATDAQGLAELDASSFIDPEIQRIADEIKAQIIATDGNWFGVTNEFLNGNRAGGGTDGVRNQETNLGNLTADANLAAAKATDSKVVLSLKNGGGIRASIGETVVLPGATEASRIAPTANPLSGRPEGGISQNAIVGALAFNNALTLLTLTKEEIVALLEFGIAASTNENTSAQGRFPQISGVNLAYDLTAPEGERLVSAAIVDENGDMIAPLVANGNLVGDPQDTFRIVTLSFLADGGDGYPFPPSLPDAEGFDPEQGARINRVDLEQEDTQTGTATFADDGTEQDALAEYLAANFPDSASAFSQTDVARELDTRLQNLAFRSDTVFEGVSPEFKVVLADDTHLVSGSSQLDYGTLYLGQSSEQLFTVVNTGAVDLVLTSASLGGTQAADFTIGSFTATTLSPGARSVFTVNFTPKTPGTLNASLTIASNSLESPFIVALQGTAATPVQPLVRSFVVRQGNNPLEDGSSEKNLGRVSVGKSSTSMAFTIQNDGTAPLNKLRIALTGKQAADFVIIQQPDRSVAPGTSTQFLVAYKPGKARQSTATLQISDRNSGENLFDIALQGTGVAPEINVLLGQKSLKSKKSVVKFGAVRADDKGKVMVLTITNDGTAALKNLNATVMGRMAKDFTVVKNPASSLAPGKSTRIKLIYLPGKAKAGKVTLLIGNNDADESPFRLSLTGKGKR
jgi:2',3'-cyclic-nucleotide 2'-phosphodiesterase (5'-nucleotidase family)/DNA-binding beta-propeller fold protein YncE